MTLILQLSLSSCGAALDGDVQRTQVWAAKCLEYTLMTSPGIKLSCS